MPYKECGLTWRIEPTKIDSLLSGFCYCDCDGHSIVFRVGVRFGFRDRDRVRVWFRVGVNSVCNIN